MERQSIRKKLVADGKPTAAAEKKRAMPEEKPKETYTARRRKYANDPDVFYGRDCEGELVKISSLQDGIGEVCIHGQLIKLEEKRAAEWKNIIYLQSDGF